MVEAFFANGIAPRVAAFSRLRTPAGLQDWKLSSGAVRTTWETLPTEFRRREAEVAALRAGLERLRAELAALE
ncbi:MAG: hypothetical protein ACP5SI_04190 [Chloroflexia bacterium]